MEHVKLPHWKTCLIIAGTFFLILFLIYGQTLRHGFVSWDDNLLIVENDIVHGISPATIKAAFTSYDPELYIPLTFVSYQFDWFIGSGNPLPFHLSNLILHAFNSLLVSVFLSMLFKNKWLALGLGLIFAVHPLHAETVAWASSRKDLLSTFFFLLSLVSYEKYATTGARTRKHEWYMASLIAFVLGLLSKVTVLMLPLVLILIDLLQRRAIRSKQIAEKAPYVGLSILFGIVALYGKTQSFVVSTHGEKFLMAFKSTWFYLVSFLLPVKLSPMYPYIHPITLSSADFFLPLLFVVSLTITVLIYCKKSLVPALGWLFFLLMLLPSFINFAKGGEVYIASDRYAYTASIGLLVIAGWLWQRRWDMANQHHRMKMATLGAGIMLGIIAVFGALSAAQASIWKDDATLYAHVLKHYPDSIASRNNMGMHYLSRGDLDTAEQYFQDVLKRTDDAPKTLVNLAMVHVEKGMYEKALAEYRQVIQKEPNLPDSYYGIGNIFLRQSKWNEAIAMYGKALEVNPDYINAYNNLGAVYLRAKKWDDAIATFQRAIVIKPSFPEAYYNLGIAYEQKGDTAHARDAYQRALDVNPGNTDALDGLKRLPKAF